MQIKIYASLSEIPKADWDGLHHGDFPFSSYTFLKTLEDTGCVGGSTGWDPVYVTAWDGPQLAGALYAYQKTHSYGEYIFDWQWAQAYQRYGVPYYPKLLSAVPFTPATGPKILTRSDRNSEIGRTAQKVLLEGALDLMRREGCASFHALFIPEEEIQVYRDAGLMLRHSFQYHWHNAGYETFESFLATLKGDRRKKIVKERRVVGEAPIEISVVTGVDLLPEHATAMYGFYRATIEKMQGIPYLTKAFFESIFASMPRHIVLCLARSQEGRWIAGALNFQKGDSLFGRYWGCAEEFSFLHFELCYYQTVDYAIRKKLKLFEAGAQGEHKLQRGFLPRITYSAHFLRDERFHKAVEQFTIEEARHLQAEIEAARVHFPFKQVRDLKFPSSD